MTESTEAPDEFVEKLRLVLTEVAAQIAPPMDPELRLYTPVQAAELLQVTENWVVERVKARRIPCTFVGRFPRFGARHIRAIQAAGEVDPATNGRNQLVS